MLLTETIRKAAGGYRIISHRTGKNLGTFPSRAAAERRLAQLARFREAEDCQGVTIAGRAVCITRGHGGHPLVGQEAASQVGACRYLSIGGRRVCITGGHNHSAMLQAGMGYRDLYFGASRPGRIRRKALPADVGTAGIGTATNLSSSASGAGHT